MSYWIFIATAKPQDGLTARDVFVQRARDQFWGLGEKTPNRRNIRQGDRAVFYVGLPEKTFAGFATISSDSFKLNEQEQHDLSHGLTTFTSEYGVRLTDVEVWNDPKQVADLLPELGFIENKEFWGSYFQGGVRELPEEDYRVIIGQRKPSLIQQLTTTRDIESESEFAMEAHLEEFLYKNWEKINWGANLGIFESDEQDGRQFPAGQWSIDFLARDRDSNSLVVIELKRGKTSDSTVGQIMRYMGWIRANIAEPNQEVRGMIIAHDYDDALRYAVYEQKNISVKTYKVDFQLIEHEK